MKERTKGIVKAVAKERERLATSKPKLKCGGRSSKAKAARRAARKSTYMQQNISAVFHDRFLCVPRHLTRSERQRFMSSTRGVPLWRKRRVIMEHIDAVFDRRCRTHTARGKRKKLRQWVKRFTWIGEICKQVHWFSLMGRAKL